MPEPTLNLKMADLYGEVGAFCGWGRGPDAGDVEWSDSQLLDIRSCVESALRMVYFQAQLDPRDPAHQWTFLKPMAELTLASGERSVPLPGDFGGFEGWITVSASSGGAYLPLELVSEPMLDARYAVTPTITGRPVMACDRPLKGGTASRSPQRELYVYPEADAAYTLRVAYYLLPNMLTAEVPYPYGGAAHAETFKAAARAAAELFLDNLPGPENQNYRMRLAGSIAYDRRHAPKTLGLNLDRSDNPPGYFPQWLNGRQTMWGYLSPVTFGGAAP